MAEIKSIPTGKIVITGDNPRQEFDLESLNQLGDSIESHGLLQPIIVRPKEDHYELVVGERRLRAAQLKGITNIIARIEDLDDSTCMELRLIENTQREDLTDAEKGDAIYALMEKYTDRYPTIKSVADSINTSYDTVRNWTRKSRKLSKYVNGLIHSGELEETHARELLKYDHPTQEKLANAIIRNEIPTTLVHRFIELYDFNPEASLTDLANEAKGVKKISIDVEKLSEEARKEVEEILEERARETEAARISALEKARSAPKRIPKRRKPRLAVETTNVIRREADTEVIPLWKAMDDLNLPYSVEFDLISIKNAERQIELGRAIKEEEFDEWEIRKLIEFAKDRPDLSVQRLVEGVKIESEERKVLGSSKITKKHQLKVPGSVWEKFRFGLGDLIMFIEEKERLYLSKAKEPK